MITGGWGATTEQVLAASTIFRGQSMMPPTRHDEDNEMNAHRIETTVNPDGTLLLQGIPFRPGDRVEVIIIERPPFSGGQDRYPLRGKPVRYEVPLEPVAEAEWDALQ